jgi:hypothetical protein
MAFLRAAISDILDLFGSDDYRIQFSN